MKTDTIEAMLQATEALGSRSRGPHQSHPAKLIMEAQKLSKALHGRYEAACNYEISDKYEKSTVRIELKLRKLLESFGFKRVDSHWMGNEWKGTNKGLYFDLQRDPRGWPLILCIEGRETRLGGK